MKSQTMIPKTLLQRLGDWSRVNRFMTGLLVGLTIGVGLMVAWTALYLKMKGYAL